MEDTVTMIEKVAEAIYEHGYGPGGWPPKREVDLGMDADYFRAAARAAIEAMRETTEGMYNAYRCDEMWRDLDSKKVWQLWIDAALTEEPSPR